MKKILSLLLMGCMLLPLAAETAKTDEVTVVPTVAVFPFAERNWKNKDDNIGTSVADLLTVSLLEQGKLDPVERTELNKILDELQLSESGLVSNETQLKIGHLVGAKIIITGSIFRTGNTNILIAKAIGSETSQLAAASVRGSADPLELVPELAAKLDKVLEEKLAQILPKPLNNLTVAGELASKVKGEGRKVYVTVTENITLPAEDPAVETELKKLLLNLGFTLVDNVAQADYVISGEGLAVHSGNFRQFTSATARLELTIKQKDKVLAVDRQVETLAGTNYPVTAKNALAQAALKLGGKLLPALAK